MERIRIPGFKNTVDEMGNVYGVRGKILSKIPNKQNGYLYVNVFAEDGSKKFLAIHKLMCLTFYGPRPEGFEARHKNGVKHHNTRTNLEWNTKAVNGADRVKHGHTTLGRRINISQANREKQRQAMIGNTIWVGRRHSEETKKKISQSKKATHV